MTAACGIYEIVCRPTGRRYVGQSLRVAGRLRGHRRNLDRGKHVNECLQRAWNKYGADAFIFKQILVCRREDLAFYERLVVNGYKTSGVFNISIIVDVTAQPEYRANMSRVLKARWRDPIFRQKLKALNHSAHLSAALKAYTASEEGRAQRSRSALKQWEDEDRRAHQSATLKETFAAPEQRARFKRNNEKMWADPEHRANISAKADVRNSDPELKRKFKAAVQRGWDGNAERRAKVSAVISSARGDSAKKDAWDAAIRASHQTLEFRKKMSGRKMSDAARAKISASKLAYWAARRAQKNAGVIEVPGQHEAAVT